MSTRTCLQKLWKNVLAITTFVGIGLGTVCGLLLNSSGASADVLAVVNYPGELFIRAFQLLILPCIIFSLISGCASLNIKENGKIAIQTFVYFFTTSFFNAIMGLVLVLCISPGNQKKEMQNGLNLNGTEKTVNSGGVQAKSSSPSLLDNLLDFGRNIVPDNIITAAFQQPKTIYVPNENAIGEMEFARKLVTIDGINFLGLVAAALVIGFVLSTLGEQVKILVDVVKAAELVVLKCMNMMIWTTPIGVASIICGKIGEVDDLTETLSILGWLILTVTIGVLIYQIVFIQLIYFLFLRKNPYSHYMNIFPAVLMAFITRSSAVTMPVTLRCMDENAKADSRISHFVISLGVTVNKDGTAMFISVASVYLAQLTGVELSLANYITIIFTATAMSIAAGGPSGSLFVLQSIGIPAHDIALLFTIDWLMDRLRTTNNVLGDCYAAVIVEHWSKAKINEDKDKTTPNALDASKKEKSKNICV